MTKRVAIHRLQTGVPGLDAVLGGGVPEFSFNVIGGAPGAATNSAIACTMRLAHRHRRSLFVAGVNHIVYHGTAYSPASDPWPGWQFYAAVEFNTRNPWWGHFKTLNDYVARSQSFLQSGVSDHDVLLYYPFYESLVLAPGRGLRRATTTELVGVDDLGAGVVERRRVPEREVRVLLAGEYDGGDGVADVEQDPVTHAGAGGEVLGPALGQLAPAVRSRGRVGENVSSWMAKNSGGPNFSANLATRGARKVIITTARKAPTKDDVKAAAEASEISVDEAARSVGVETDELLGRTTLFKHGSTVATNALITRSGVKVGFITTRGFEDTTEIMRAIGRV